VTTTCPSNRPSESPAATLEWVDWFNNRRLMEPIGNIPPAEVEARYYAIPKEPAMAA
jgi:putative transposase